MNVFAIISLIATVSCFALGLIVLSMNHKATLNRLFFFVTLTGFIYSFTTVMMWSASTAEEAFIWHKLGTIWPLFTVAVFNFTLVFTDSKWIKFKVHYIAIYLPAIIFFLIDLLTASINTAPVLMYWGYNDLPSGSWVFALSSFWLNVISFSAFGVCFRYYLKAKEEIQKQRAKYVSIGLAIPIVAFITTNVVARGLNIGIPNFGPIATLFFAIIVTAAIGKFDLFTVDAALAAENIVSTIPDSLILASKNAKILKVNDRLVEFLGYSRDELIGQPISMLCCEDPEKSSVLFSRIKQEKIIRNFELKMRTKSGESRHVLLSASMIHDRAGRLIGFTLIFRDTTERIMAEQELANTKNYLETLLNSMLTGVLVIDAKTHKVVDVNFTALSMIGLQREEVVGRVCHRFVCPSECGRCPITDLGLEVDSSEKILVTAKGEQKQILKSVTKLQLENQLLLVENFIDISQRKKIEEQLVRAQRLASIGELAGQLGHDLRNPLSGIKNGIYLVKKKGNSMTEEERREILKIIDAAVEDSNRIVNSLIEYSNEMILTPELITPKQLMLNALAKLTVPSGITIENKATDETPTLLDTVYMENVFTAILRNAIEATPQKGTIILEANLAEASIVFSFKDSGVGISEEALRKLFTPLFTTKAKGMGMSLAICKRVVEAHGGKIAVESRVGVGTTVTVTLPMVTSRREFADLQAHLNSM